MFKQRLLTTLVLLPLVLAIIYYAPSWLLASMLLLLIAASSWEWTKLVPLERLEFKLAYVVVTLLVFWISSHVFMSWLMFGIVAWFLVFLAVVTYPVTQSYWGYPMVVGCAGLVFLSLFSNAFLNLYQHVQGQHLIVYVFSLVWAADIGAYLAGKQWGRIKLIPQVSPGKTVEGTLGGFVLAMGVSIIGYYFFQPTEVVLWFVWAGVTSLISVVGDLSISMLKRRTHLKDSGHLIPGHGGILDRLDSSFAAFPIFYLALSLLELGH